MVYLPTTFIVKLQDAWFWLGSIATNVIDNTPIGIFIGDVMVGSDHIIGILPELSENGKINLKIYFYCPIEKDLILQYPPDAVG